MPSREIREALERSLDQLVHGSVADDRAETRRHRGFIAAHLVAGCLAFGLMPLCLAANLSIAAFVATGLSIIGLEALVALYVSRTGGLARGYLLSAVILVALVAWVAVHTGGLSSFATVWFAVAPIEAALSGNRRTITAAALTGVAGFCLVALASFVGVPARPLAIPGGSGLVNLVAMGAGLAYAVGVAISIERRERFSSEAADLRDRHYRLLADTMSDLVTCHGVNGDVSFASPAAGRLLAVRQHDLVADGLFRRVHVADRPAYLTALSTALHEGEAQVQYRLRRGDDPETDGWVWVESHIRRPDGEVPEGAAVVAVTRDISERKLHESELETFRNRAEAASIAKTRFLANMSHELRTPLNAIIGFSDILAQELFGKFEYDRYRDYAGLIKESGEHLLQLVNDILDLSKIESGSFDVSPEPFDLTPVVDRCCQLLRPQADKAGVALAVEVEAELPELFADPRACRQILINLVCNAIKFSKAGGTVTCGARRDGRRIAVFVRDNGIGIAPEDLPRLGTPFVQAETGYDRQHEGTGLGLSVVKGLAGLHGGQMQIESELGKGTTVTISLPLAPGHEAVTPLPRVQQFLQTQRTARRA